MNNYLATDLSALEAVGNGVVLEKVNERVKVMNAAQMRIKSKENSHKIAVSMKEQFIIQANKKIEERASEGYLNALIQVVNNPTWNEYFLTEVVSMHYTKLGFKVEVTPFLLSLNFRISWAEGDETYES
ncbi:hypothetical protein [Niallia sp. 01092]|uniref:hypothetical protein n=1 Tax=unclassified Niallia TaxID=2837522 RepID=UPI003FD281AB